MKGGRLTIVELQEVEAAVVSQIALLKDHKKTLVGNYEEEVLNQIKILRSALKKIRKVLKN